MSRFVGDSEAVNFNSSLKSLESLGYDFDEGAHGAKLPLKEESGASTAGVGDLAEQLILDALEAIGKRDVQAVQEYEDARDARAERRRPRSTNIEISMEDFERYYTQQYNVLVERVPSAQERITSQEAHPLSDIKDTPEERISFGRVDHTPNSASDSTKSAISTEENWIGRLQEFFQGNPEYGWFTEETRELPDKKFTCVVTLPEFKVFFGKDSEGYSTKKEAKREACRAAMQHLYARGLTSSYISTREMRKKRNERTATKDPLIKSMRVQVNELCAQLQFALPCFVLEEVPVKSGYFSGTVHFNDPRVPEKIRDVVLGTVTCVFTKVEAKEVLARAVLDTLHQNMSEPSLWRRP